MSVSPKVSMWLSIAIAVLGVFSSGVLARPSFVSDQMHRDILAISGDTAAVLGAFMAALHAYSAPQAGPMVGKASASTMSCLALFGLLIMSSAVLRPSEASAAPRRHAAPLPVKRPVGSTLTDIGGKLGLTGSATTDLNAAIAKIQNISLADLTAAKADADATGDAIGSACYASIAKLVAAQQSVQSPPQDTSNPGGVIPTTHVVLTFQRGRDFVNALRPGSAVSVACAPLAEEVHMDVVTWMGQVAAGTVTLASFGL